MNYFLTLCDTLRVAEDMGKIQFQLRALHMPILGWKGSFIVSQVNILYRSLVTTSQHTVY